MSEKTIFKEALALPPKKRAKLVDALLQSLEDNGALQSAFKEAERRWQAFTRGETKGIPAEEVFPGLASRR